MHDSNLMSRLKQLLTHKRSKEFYATKLGISKQQVEELLDEIKGKPSSNYSSSTHVNTEKDSIRSEIELDYEPKDVDELYVLHKVDKKRYKISNYWSKLKSTGKFTSSIFATARKGDDYSVEDFQKFLDTYVPPKVLVHKEIKYDFKEAVDVELSIADFHLGKKTIDDETVADRKATFLNITNNLISSARNMFNINKIVFVISNDFFHTDTFYNTTTNGTPQDVLVRYDHEYEEGFDLLVSAIQILREYGKEVHVILVQGNHDRTKSFYLAHALEVFFKRDKAITFDREHSPTKSVVLGNTFIGYHHGNCKKLDELPLLFATGKVAKDFGNAKYREVHTGDKHHYLAKEVKGVRIQQLPSLSGTDNWHLDHNFVNNIRAAILFIYHPVRGKIGELEERIDNDY